MMRNIASGGLILRFQYVDHHQCSIYFDTTATIDYVRKQPDRNRVYLRSPGKEAAAPTFFWFLLVGKSPPCSGTVNSSPQEPMRDSTEHSIHIAFQTKIQWKLPRNSSTYEGRKNRTGMMCIFGDLHMFTLIRSKLHGSLRSDGHCTPTITASKSVLHCGEMFEILYHRSPTAQFTRSIY